MIKKFIDQLKAKLSKKKNAEEDFDDEYLEEEYVEGDELPPEEGEEFDGDSTNPNINADSTAQMTPDEMAGDDLSDDELLDEPVAGDDLTDDEIIEDDFVEEERPAPKNKVEEIKYKIQDALKPLMAKINNLKNKKKGATTVADAGQMTEDATGDFNPGELPLDEAAQKAAKKKKIIQIAVGVLIAYIVADEMFLKKKAPPKELKKVNKVQLKNRKAKAKAAGAKAGAATPKAAATPPATKSTGTANTKPKSSPPIKQASASDDDEDSDEESEQPDEAESAKTVDTADDDDDDDDDDNESSSQPLSESDNNKDLEISDEDFEIPANVGQAPEEAGMEQAGEEQYAEGGGEGQYAQEATEEGQYAEEMPTQGEYPEEAGMEQVGEEQYAEGQMPLEGEMGAEGMAEGANGEEGEAAEPSYEDITENILKGLEDRLNAQLQQRTVSIKKKKNTDFNQLGRGLVYSCKGKHWACVNAINFGRCENNFKYFKFNGLKPECFPENVYASDDDCGRAQQRMIDLAIPSTFCE